MTIFGERLKELMSERNMTARSLSSATKIPHGTITQWTRGETMPNSKSLIKLCVFFKISADWLLGLSNFRRVKT